MHAAANLSLLAAAIHLRTPSSHSVLIPSSKFVMGSTSSEIEFAGELCLREPLGDENCVKAFDNELEAHEVELSAFWLDRMEVTVADYHRCVEAARCAPPPYAEGATRFDRPQFPVSLVDWNDALAYCSFNGQRLPTEAEWERAARGVVGRRFPWGNNYQNALANRGAFALDNSEERDGFAELAPVGSFPLGATAEGVWDLAGNVEEWVADGINDVFDARYPAASEVNPQGSGSGPYRITRGGSYASGIPWLRGAARVFHPMSSRKPWIGFRCAGKPSR